VIPARGAPAGTGPPYGVGLRDGLYGQVGVALAFEMGEVPRPCVQSQGDIAERSRIPPSRAAARPRSTRFGLIDRSVERSPCPRRCRRTEASCMAQGDRTPLELSLASVRGWEAGLRWAFGWETNCRVTVATKFHRRAGRGDVEL